MIFFFFVSNSCLSNYTEDNTLYAFGYNLEIKNTLRFDFDLVSNWFEEKHMVLNADKCHFKCLGKDAGYETFIFSNLIFNNSNEVKILGIIIDNKLTFKSHIKILCRKATQKIGRKYFSIYLNSILTHSLNASYTDIVFLYGCFVLEHQII